MNVVLLEQKMTELKTIIATQPPKKQFVYSTGIQKVKFSDVNALFSTTESSPSLKL
jgi:hypothetical protein